MEYCRHGVTRHLFYLQLRRDILEENVHCDEEQALRLAALALQVCLTLRDSLGFPLVGILNYHQIMATRINVSRYPVQELHVHVAPLSSFMSIMQDMVLWLYVRFGTDNFLQMLFLWYWKKFCHEIK